MNFRPQGFNFLPEVVKHLLILNILFYIVLQVVYRYNQVDLTYSLGLHYPGAPDFKPYQFLSYMFLHSRENFMHIFFNMFAVWMFGSVIEQRMGSSRFLIYYLVTGIGAALLHNLVVFLEINPTLDQVNMLLASPSYEGFQAFINSEYFIFDFLNQGRVLELVDSINQTNLYDPLLAQSQMQDFLVTYRDALLNAPIVVGASGSVFGILLAFGLLFPNTYLYLYFAIPIKAKYFVIMYGALELFLAIKNSPNDNVAHFAHLGGMAFGYILIRIWKLDRNRNPYE